MGVGCMSRTGDGRGFRMTRGAGLLITMADGCMTMRVGDGGQDRRMDIRSIVRSGRRRMYHSLASAAALALASADGATWDGFRWVRATGFIRGGAVMDASARPVGVDITAADLLRCMVARGFRM
jgi:hypothetical protein